MLKRSEKRKIEAKKKEWDRIMRDFTHDVEKVYKVVKKEIEYNATNWLDWYFGDKGVKPVEKMLRRLCVLCVDIVLLRVLGFI